MVIDLSWKIAHGVLYTAKRLSSFGYAISTGASAIVRQNQRSTSLFIVLWARRLLTQLIQSHFFLAASLAPMIYFSSPFAVWFWFWWTYRYLFPGFSSIFFFCLEILHLVSEKWLSLSFCAAPSAIGLLASVKARVRFHLSLFSRRFRSYRRRRYFPRQWGANGVQLGILSWLLTCKSYFIWLLNVVALVGCTALFFHGILCVQFFQFWFFFYTTTVIPCAQVSLAIPKLSRELGRVSNFN